MSEITDLAKYLEEERNAFVARVESEGGKIIIPSSHEAQIDIDTNEQFSVFERIIGIFSKMIDDGIEYRVVESKSGLPRRHIYVTTPFPMTDIERIAFQATLGSDPIREMFGFIRIMNQVEHPTLFAEWE